MCKENNCGTLSYVFRKSWSIEVEMDQIVTNVAIDIENVSRKEWYQRVLRKVSVKEFKVFRALVIGASVHGK